MKLKLLNHRLHQDKILLNLTCRNRLLLTGTQFKIPCKNYGLFTFHYAVNFDSHDEFSDWFAKDIESHAQSIPV